MDLRSDRYTLSRSETRRKDLVLRFDDDEGEPVCRAVTKILSLKGDARVYADEELTEEIWRVRTRGPVLTASRYDVIESGSDRLIGSLEHTGIGAVWKLFDANEKEIGRFESPRFRYYLSFVLDVASHISLIPRHYVLRIGIEEPCRITAGGGLGRKSRNYYELDFTGDLHHRFDRRMALAFAILRTILP